MIYFGLFNFTGHYVSPSYYYRENSESLWWQEASQHHRPGSAVQLSDPTGKPLGAPITSLWNLLFSRSAIVVSRPVPGSSFLRMQKSCCEGLVLVSSSWVCRARNLAIRKSFLFEGAFLIVYTPNPDQSYKYSPTNISLEIHRSTENTLNVAHTEGFPSASNLSVSAEQA